MAIFEYSGTLKYKDKAGNLHIMKPRTTSGNVEGLTQLLAEKENSGAAATALENAKAYTDQKIEGIPTPDVSAQIKAHNESQDVHPYIRGLIPTKTSQIENDSGYLTQHQDISGKLDKPANDAAAKAGQLLTKTVNGQEWQDREKDVLVVNMTMNDGSIQSADKTFDEVYAAYNTGKTVIADLYLSQIDAHYILPSVALIIGEGIMFAAINGSSSVSILMTPTDIIPQDIKMQDQIDAEGILKGNGNGNISAAVAGTDYVAPNGDASNVTAAFTAASTRANIATGEKLSVLFGKIAKWFTDLGSLAFKSTVAKSDLASDVQTELSKAGAFIVTVTWDNAQRKYVANQTYANLRAALNAGKTCIAVYGGTRYICSTEPLTNNSTLVFSSVEATSEYKTIYTLTIASTDVISISSARLTYFPNSTNLPNTLLKGTSSSGLISSAIPGTDYIASGNIVKQTLVATETTPTENYAINWVYG